MLTFGGSGVSRLREFRGFPLRGSVQEAHISRVQSAHIGRVRRVSIGEVKGPAKKGPASCQGVQHQKIKGSHIRSLGPTSGGQGALIRSWLPTSGHGAPY